MSNWNIVTVFFSLICSSVVSIVSIGAHEIVSHNSNHILQINYQPNVCLFAINICKLIIIIGSNRWKMIVVYFLLRFAGPSIRRKNNNRYKDLKLWLSRLISFYSFICKTMQSAEICTNGCRAALFNYTMNAILHDLQL